MRDLKNLDNSLWILSTMLLWGCLIEKKTGWTSFSSKNSDQIGGVNCVPWSVIIFKGFQYFGKWSLDKFLMTALVFACLNGYKTTHFEKASIVDKIYLKPSFDAGNGP